MKGEKVIVRAYGNKALIRRIWDAHGNVVYVLSEENYNKMVDGFKTPPPIGFPRIDVFINDINFKDDIDNDLDWNSLTPLA